MDAQPHRIDLESLRQTVDDLSPRSRLLSLPDRARSGCLHFRTDARTLRARLADGDWLPASDPALASDPEAGSAREDLERLMRLDARLRDSLGIDALMFGIGLATWQDGHTLRSAPLLLSPAEILPDPSEPRLRSVGPAQLNPTLLRRLGLTPETFPDDPLDHRPRENGPGRLVAIEPTALLGIFTTTRLMLHERLDARRFVRLLRSPVSGRLIGQEPAQAAPGHAAWPPGSLPGDPSADAAQARVLDRIGAGESLVVEGPPGTGKTRLVSTLARAAARGGRSVLVVSDTLAALESIERQIAEARDCPAPLRLYGASARSDALARTLGRIPGSSPSEMLRDLSRAKRPGVILASTLSYIANVPEEWSFDLVLIDDAAQIPLAHVLPAVAAGKQAAIFGDPRQLAPTAHLSRVLDSVIGNDAPASLMDAARASLPLEQLTHHYRSRHPALFQGSNRLFYEDRVRIAPGPRHVGSRGLISVRVPGRYDRRSSQTNPAEANAVVEHLARLRKAGSTQSVLIVALTDPQRDLIAQRLREADLPPATGDTAEPLLVGTADSIQGIERDIVLVSVTFGPDQVGGAAPANFGTLALPGSERRVNVMMTRARDATILFASVPADGITRNRSAGQNALITFLRIAERRAILPGTDYAGPLSALLEISHCKAKSHGQALALEDLTGRSIGALYVTGAGDPRDEAAEMLQLARNGWKVAAVTTEEAARCADAPENGARIRDLISDFRTSL